MSMVDLILKTILNNFTYYRLNTKKKKIKSKNLIIVIAQLNQAKYYEEQSYNLSKTIRETPGNNFIELNNSTVLITADENFDVLNLSNEEIKNIVNPRGHGFWIDVILKLKNKNILTACTEKIIIWNGQKLTIEKVLRIKNLHDAKELNNGFLALIKTEHFIILDRDYKPYAKIYMDYSPVSVYELPNKSVLLPTNESYFFIWNQSSKNKLNRLETFSDSFDYFAYLPENEILACTVYGDYNVYLITKPSELTKPKKLKGHTDLIILVVELEDLTIATSSRDHTIRIWDYNYNNCIKVLLGHTDSVNIEQLRDKRLITVLSDGSIRLWDLNFANSKVLIEGIEYFYKIRQLSDGRLMALSDKFIYLWE
jgi:WD40 repeat protein